MQAALRLNLMGCLQISVEISGANGEVKLRAAGSQILFTGYLRAFKNFNTGQEASSGQTGTSFRSRLRPMF